MSVASLCNKIGDGRDSDGVAISSLISTCAHCSGSGTFTLIDDLISDRLRQPFPGFPHFPELVQAQVLADIRSMSVSAGLTSLSSSCISAISIQVLQKGMGLFFLAS